MFVWTETDPESPSVLPTDLDQAGVEEGDGREEEAVGDLGQEETERLLVSTAALAAGEGGQQGPEVGRLAEDGLVGGHWDSLTAVEDQVAPPLLPHVAVQAGQHQVQPVLLTSPRHHGIHSSQTVQSQFYLYSALE